MSFLSSIRTFFITKNRRDLFIYYGIFLAILLLTAGAIITTHFSALTKLNNQLKEVNKYRETARHILLKNKEILAQQEAVKTILAQEPNFLIGKYFSEELMKQISLPVTSGPDMTEMDVGNGFFERRLTVAFSHITMKQLAEFLLKIEQKERVYTKEIKITKDIKDGLLNVTLMIATLEPQQSLA